MANAFFCPSLGKNQKLVRNCTIDRTGSGEEILTIGNGGTGGHCCIANTAEGFLVSTEASGHLKERTSVPLILLISLHNISGLMDGMQSINVSDNYNVHLEP